MELLELQYFVAVADAGNFTRAARDVARVRWVRRVAVWIAVQATMVTSSSPLLLSQKSVVRMSALMSRASSSIQHLDVAAHPGWLTLERI
jgi:hypothetical protein